VAINDDKSKRLETVTQTIQNRWGQQSLRTLKQVEISCISTTYPQLDQALGIGGIPRGRITEILGHATSGAATLMMRIIGSGQAADNMIVYIDSEKTFNPVYAAYHGLKSDKTLLVQAATPENAAGIARELIVSGGVGVLAIRVSDTRKPSPGLLGQLNSAVGQSSCALLVLHDPMRGESWLSFYASVRLQLVRERWLRKRQQICGLRARVTILKNKLAAPGRPVSITIPIRSEA
jgi:recombination protein RecA